MATAAGTSAAGPLLITPGEPAGVGPDLVIDLAQRGLLPPRCRVVADPQLLLQRARQLGASVKIDDVGMHDPAQAAPGQILVWPEPLAQPVAAGRLDPRNAPYVLRCLDRAADACLAGQAAALITGPVQKSVINDAGIAFSGHTEYLAARCGGASPVMMLVAGSLRVALATTHLPLRAVADAIDQASLLRCLRIVARDLSRLLHLPNPRILVCGLNPHAGEGGHLGSEEIHIIVPVIEQARREGINARGPLPADTAFTPAQLSLADVVLAMYHDQGLPTLKFAGFGHAVNVTLGLPIFRSSVDHGTALDLAASGRADSGSLRAAIELAQQVCTPVHA